MEDALFSYIGKAEDLAVELETELCKYPAIAPESGGDGELSKALWLENWLKNRGFPLERIDIADERAGGGIRPNLVVDVSAACSAGSFTPLGCATGGSSNGNAGTLWIMSHLDVVPPGELSLWESDPWTVIRRDDGPL